MRKTQRSLQCAALTVLITVNITVAVADVCDCPGFSETEIAGFDSAVILTDLEKEQSIARNLPWGIPIDSANANNESTIIQRHFILDYDADLNTSVWAAYRLTSEEVDANQPGFVARKDCFRNYPAALHPDDTPPLCSDYDNDSYDRGHLVNSNDMRRSRTANANSFFLTNMAPQYDVFNQKIWRTLEDWVNRWARQKGEIFIITGAVFDEGPNGVPDGVRDPDDETKRNDGDGRIAVASQFYKILLHERDDGEIETLSILVPHLRRSYIGDARKPYLQANITTMREIEDLTGLIFLPKLVLEDPEKAAAIKEFRAKKLWPLD